MNDPYCFDSLLLIDKIEIEHFLVSKTNFKQISLKLVNVEWPVITFAKDVAYFSSSHAAIAIHES